MKQMSYPKSSFPISENKFFYDVIYNPGETNFLKTGRKLGSKTLNGKLMFKECLSDTKTTIDMLDYPESTYLLSVQENNLIIKTFKIIKK